MNVLKYFYILVFLFLLSSCNDILNVDPHDSVTNENFWNTAEDFKIGANNFYNTLPGIGGSGADTDSDIQYGTGINSVSSGTNVVPSNDGFWNDRYSMLRQINNLLERAGEYEDPETIKVSVAEAKFFRAYEYFRLVKRYGDVPYYERPLEVDSEGLKAPRMRRDSVVSHVLEDLDEAIPNLPLESETNGSDQGRVTQGAALALKAKVALFEGTWAKYHGTEGNVNNLLDQAIDAANTVINSGEYELFIYGSEPELSYKMSYSAVANDSKEQILARRYSLENDIVHNWTREAISGQSLGTKKLADMYLATDGLPISTSPLFEGYDNMSSEYENRDLRMSNTFHVPGTPQVNNHTPDGDEPFYPLLLTEQITGYAPNKFVEETYPEALSFQSYNFKHILKYNEVLLTLAEALYERNGEISDQDLNRTINVLRDRAGVNPLTNAFVEANDMDMLEEIRRERTVELAWDGVRLNDLKRWKTAVDELSLPVKGVNLGSGAWNSEFPEVSERFPLDENGFRVVQAADTRHFSERNYLFPIPSQQIQLNENLEQNPGW